MDEPCHRVARDQPQQPEQRQHPTNPRKHIFSLALYLTCAAGWRSHAPAGFEPALQLPLDKDLFWLLRRELDALDGLDHVKRNEVIHNEPSIQLLLSQAGSGSLATTMTPWIDLVNALQTVFKAVELTSPAPSNPVLLIAATIAFFNASILSEWFVFILLSVYARL